MATASVNSAREYQIVNGGSPVVADGPIAAYNVVKPGTDKNVRGGKQVAVAGAKTDELLGAVQSATDLADGGKSMLHMQAPDRPLVKLGGTVNRGDLLTSGDGTAVVAGTGEKFFGRACDYGVIGDIIAYVPVHGKLP